MCYGFWKKFLGYPTTSMAELDQSSPPPAEATTPAQAGTPDSTLLALAVRLPPWPGTSRTPPPTPRTSALPSSVQDAFDQMVAFLPVGWSLRIKHDRSLILETIYTSPRRTHTYNTLQEAVDAAHA